MFLGATAALAQEGIERELQLQVFINGADTRLIAAFRQDRAGRLLAQAGELRAVGLRPPDGTQPLQWVALDDVASLRYAFDEPAQAVRVDVADAGRAVRNYSLRGSIDPDETPIERNPGAVLNYDLFSSFARSDGGSGRLYQGASATLDGRVFSRLGTLSQTGIVGQTLTSGVTALRLDSAWSYADPARMVEYKAGDTISSGLAWTRPIRMGGLQAQRRFGLRPDLVTLPLPSFSGSAAVPTDVDVYVNNSKMLTTGVDAGPYRLVDLPITGAGSARFVTVDAAGRRSEHDLSFLTSPMLLRPGLTDFSVEAGFARRGYGVDSFNYDETPVVSASLRHGLTERVTLEAHGEATADFANAGVGGVFNVSDRVLINLAAAGSHAGGRFGASPYVSLETHIGPLTVGGSYQRSFGDYRDLASMTVDTAVPFSGKSSRPARETARLSVGARMWDGSSLSLGLTRAIDAEGEKHSFANLSWSRRGPFDSSLYASAFASLSGERRAGVFVGFSKSLGDRTSLSASVSSQDGGLAGGFEAGRYLGPEDGDYGWRLRKYGSGDSASELSAAGAYRNRYGTVRATAGRYGDANTMSLQASGALAAMGGGVYAANAIPDSFAVVDAKAPGVPVLFENNPIGTTGANGKLLVPGLRSWEANTLAIDTNALPVDARVTETRRRVRPADRQGVVVDFGVDLDARAAVVILVDDKGAPLAAGSLVARGDGGEESVVGYDGRTYLLGLKAQNTVRVETAAGACTATFAFKARGSGQQEIGPVPCR